MRVDTLNELRTMFAGWRGKKRYVREAVPRALLERARRAAEVHGVGAVVRVTGVERARLSGGRRGEPVIAAPAALPTYSRLELSAPSSGARPIAEVQTQRGTTLRVFAESEAMVGLLWKLCGMGGA